MDAEKSVSSMLMCLESDFDVARNAEGVVRCGSWKAWWQQAERRTRESERNEWPRRPGRVDMKTSKKFQFPHLAVAEGFSGLLPGEKK